MKFHEKLSYQIREARKKAGLSQEQLGEKIGKTQVQISQYETGFYKPSPETIAALEKALGYKFDIVLIKLKSES